MAVTTTQINPARMFPLGGSHKRYKLGFIEAGAKLLKDDIWEINNVADVKSGVFTTDASGISEPVTVSTATLTLTGATGSAASGLVIFRK